MTQRYTVESLRQLATALFAAAGMDGGKARAVAEVLVAGDMVGQRTHGMALCPQYLGEIEKGAMAARGEPAVVRDSGAVFVWDGNYLPGPWLVSQACAQAAGRVAEHGVVTAVIRRSHHIACLMALLGQATGRGLAIILASSDPAFGYIAPYGGKEPLFTPNPIAIGYPGTEAPVWIDVSTSITTVGMARQKAAAGASFAHPWLMDAEGHPSNDPRVIDPGAGGTLLPLGGREYGHKGFGLSLMVEMLTHGLGGFGRLDSEPRWGANVFLQLIDPAAFAGRDAFLRQMDFLAGRCHANVPIDPANPVRMPGEMAQRRMREAERSGIDVAPKVWEALAAAAAKYGVALPGPV
ncbi:MAG: Ldh family oxidoreductase [Candidatus Accumulibacter sp.]|jgi:L-lactate dehydrogenase|nr:Ldh family oxidoreductase [Accumulibacter sp.]